MIETYMTYRGINRALGKVGSIDFGYRFKPYRLAMFKTGDLSFDATPALIRSTRVRIGKSVPTPSGLSSELYPTVFKAFSDVY